jgi:uncharacterized protein (DUF58 family)
MFNFFSTAFLTKRFYLVFCSIIILYVVSFFVKPMYSLVNAIFFAAILLFIVDVVFLYVLFKSPTISRIIRSRLSNGEKNSVSLQIKNNMAMPLLLEVVEELPQQFQERNMAVLRSIQGKGEISIDYAVTPLQRGVYDFGSSIVFCGSALKLLQRKVYAANHEKVHVYPAFSQLSKLGLIAETTQNEQGSKRVRKIGQSTEFEQIKEYIIGDDVKRINWKATARKGDLMINTYTEEKSQQIYCVIDKGRVMKMPFAGLSLLDYTINATLGLSSVCLQRQDRIGLLTFSNKMDASLAADRQAVQREKIMDVLYNESTNFMESDFEMLYMQVRQKVKQRSLIILFTNFESLNGLKRQLSYLRSIAKHHLLLVVFFENTELNQLTNVAVKNVEEAYVKTIAEKLAFEKRLVVKELFKYGILSILTKPENLTVSVINKYVELKQKEMI